MYFKVFPKLFIMKYILILILFLFIEVYGYCQDVVVKTNGEKIFGKILKDDSTKLVIQTFPDGNDTKTEIEKYRIKTIIYNYKKSDEKLIKYNKADSDQDKFIKEKMDEDRNSAITVGFLNGGGALIGFDMEIMVSKRFGIQIGGGYIGYGAGVNFHFSPRINSSFLSIQYWNQGHESSFVQSLIGPSLVFRARKLLTAQIGLGYVLERGPAYPESLGTPSAILTYSIGLFFPLKAN